MIYVDGLPISSTLSSPSQQGNGNLGALLEHPTLASAANLFKSIPEQKFSVSEQFREETSWRGKHVYVFQREYATVDPSLVELVGTDEATTCVGLVIRNRETGMTSVAHLDSPRVVNFGLTQMLSLVIDNGVDADLDVHLIGGFEDALNEHSSDTRESGSYETSDGYSLPLCSKIIEALQNSREKFHIQTLCVLRHNTSRDSGGNACPIVNGFLVETSTGAVRPANFERSSRCPDEIVRRVRVTVSLSSMDSSWTGKLLETYDTHHDRFQIFPCFWTSGWKDYAFSLQQFSDSEILLQCSSSPFAESPDFVENERRVFDYLINNPDWAKTFPMRKPRVFERTPSGTWLRCKQHEVSADTTSNSKIQNLAP